jgi:uncharacterized protein
MVAQHSLEGALHHYRLRTVSNIAAKPSLTHLMPRMSVNIAIAIITTINDNSLTKTFDDIEIRRPALAVSYLSLLEAQPRRPLDLFCLSACGGAWIATMLQQAPS